MTCCRLLLASHKSSNTTSSIDLSSGPLSSAFLTNPLMPSIVLLCTDMSFLWLSQPFPFECIPKSPFPWVAPSMNTHLSLLFATYCTKINTNYTIILSFYWFIHYESSCPHSKTSLTLVVFVAFGATRLVTMYTLMCSETLP